VIEVVSWCSLFCQGNEATGELTIMQYPDTIVIPICDECKEKVDQRLDKPLGGVVE
jgi:hypothetical protein